MKRTALIFTLLFALTLLTACHTDNDPWPTNDSLLSPTAAPTATSEPLIIGEPLLTPIPTAVPTAVPTELPVPNEAPGING